MILSVHLCYLGCIFWTPLNIADRPKSLVIVFPAYSTSRRAADLFQQRCRKATTEEEDVRLFIFVCLHCDMAEKYVVDTDTGKTVNVFVNENG